VTRMSAGARAFMVILIGKLSPSHRGELCACPPPARAVSAEVEAKRGVLMGASARAGTRRSSTSLGRSPHGLAVLSHLPSRCTHVFHRGALAPSIAVQMRR
jgi:hypothetical protein